MQLREKLNQAFSKVEGSSPIEINGVWYFKSLIIVGQGKSQQIQAFPFRTYYSELDRLVHQSDAVLFLGYGFNDSHINLAFKKYFEVDAAGIRLF
jgi:hypothetical protein